MATSGSFSTSSVGNFYFTFSWSRTGYSSSANEHYIYYELVAHNTAGSYRTVYLKNLYVAGSQVFYTEGASSSGKQYYDGDVVTSGNIPVASSDSDGNGSLSASFEAGVGVWPSSNCSGSSSWALDTIPRASTPSVSETTIGSTMTITTNRASSSFTHTLTYSIGSYSGTIATGVEASTTWTIPATLANAMPNNTSGTLTIGCTTYNRKY